MSRAQDIAVSVKPWLIALESLSGRVVTPVLAESLPSLRDALHALANGQEAVPAELPAADPATPLDGWLRRSTRPTGFNDVRRRRDALLRLGVWRALRALEEASGEGAAEALDALQVWMGRDEVGVPPGLGPALAYAAGDAAQRFFDRDLRAALGRLAERHDARGARFATLARAPAYEPSAVGLHVWTRAWSAAVAAVYLDWLRQSAQGSLERALHGLWRADSVRFRAPSGLVVLPTRERSMHVDLWTDLVSAQALEHDAARFDAAGQPWHRVRIAMHDLGERDRGGRASGGVRTIFRGLGVEMLYQTVFAGRARAALAAQGGADDVNAPERPPPAAALVIDVPMPRPGQQANLELVLRWHEPRGGTRFETSPPPPRLDERQRRVLEAWRHERCGGEAVAERLDERQVDWCSAAADDRFVDDEGHALVALGHAALWRTAGEGADWIDVALVAHVAERWVEVPLVLLDEALDGEVRTWLLLAADTPAVDADRLRAALAASGCWVARRAGIGVFVMAGVATDTAAPVDARR